MSATFRRIDVKKVLALTSSPDVLKSSFLGLQSNNALADLLECSLQQLIYWARIAPAGRKYRTFEIAKRSGARRKITAPSPVLQVLQRKLLQVIEAAYEPRAPVHGFVKGRGIRTNAEQHTRRAWVLNLDLAEFFPTIHFGRVRGIFHAKPFGLSESVATTIAQLICSEGVLPQGAPTSPIVSNIICSKMDGDLRRFAKEHGSIYTRYADDLTFSVGRRRFPQALGEVRESPAGDIQFSPSQALVGIIAANGFALNDAKVRLAPRTRSQRVTGLVVNRAPNVPRRFVRTTRAMLNAWASHGLPAAQAYFQKEYGGPAPGLKNPTPFKSAVRGNIAYIGQIRGRDDAVYRKLLSEYHRLLGDPLIELPAMKDNAAIRDVFICHASEDKATVVEPLVAAFQEAQVAVWFDRSEIGWGDTISGKINEGLRTSRYVLVVISASFLAKNWARKELNAAMAREVNTCA